MNGRRTLLACLTLCLWAHGGQAQDAPPQAAPEEGVSLARFDDPAIDAAIRAAVAEMPRLPDKGPQADFAGMTPAQQEQARIDQAFEAAKVPDCLHADAMKLAPPVIRLGGVPIVLGGVLALPHLFYAASTGKCH